MYVHVGYSLLRVGTSREATPPRDRQRRSGYETHPDRPLHLCKRPFGSHPFECYQNRATRQIRLPMNHGTLEELIQLKYFSSERKSV